MSTWGDLITDALLEIGVTGVGDPTPAAPDSQLAIRKLNRIVDQWAARQVFAFATSFTKWTLTPNLSPHTIGPSGTFVTTRPVRLRSAALVLISVTPNTDLPLNLRDRAWWAEQRSKGITSTVPTDLYYETDYPNGALYLWPLPTFAYGLRLETESEISSVPLVNGNPDTTQTFAAPPGYELAVMLTLAEQLVTPYGRPMPPELPGRAAAARVIVQSNNVQSPRIQSVDAGTRGRTRGGFNWATGLPE